MTSQSMRNALLALVAMTCSGLLHAAAGTLNFAAGQVTAVDSRGTSRLLSKGAEINSGDTISTGVTGRAQIRFSDGALVSLQPDTQFKVDEYRFEGKTDGSEKGFFSLIKGGMRAISGLVGRFNRDNYKVNTPVATIGIRGTEYSATMKGSELVVNTGEGLVQVCNGAGCILLASGETGIISGGDQPRRTEIKPVLNPASTESQPSLPVFSSAENRSATGEIVTVSTPMVSGSGYVSSMAYWNSDVSELDRRTDSGVNATFNEVSELQKYATNLVEITGGASEGAFSIDGVIGWGRWATATYTDLETSDVSSLKDVHYVVGQPTSSSDLTALGGTTATYQLAGFTSPTSTTGLVGQLNSGSLTLSFSGSSISSSSLALNVSIGGTTYDWSSASGYGYSGATFSGYGSDLNYEGFVAGSNASHAGVVYSFEGGGSVGTVSGAAAFKR